MTPEQKAKATEFKRELKALLEKYDGSIDFGANGDMEGMYNEEMNVCIKDTTVFSVAGWSIGPNDIKI